MPSLREWNLGDLEGHPCSELWEKYSEIMNCFSCKSPDIPVPRGESHQEFELKNGKDMLIYNGVIHSDGIAGRQTDENMNNWNFVQYRNEVRRV